MFAGDAVVSCPDPGLDSCSCWAGRWLPVPSPELNGESCHYRIKLFDNNENDNKPEILEVRCSA